MYSMSLSCSRKCTSRMSQTTNKARWRWAAVSALTLAMAPILWSIGALVRWQVITFAGELQPFTSSGATFFQTTSKSLPESSDEEERRRRMLDVNDRSLASLSTMSLNTLSTVQESTILFLHVFKCAGTSLRYVMLEWARKEGWSGIEVEECKNMERWGNAPLVIQKKRICVDVRNDLMDPLRQRWKIASQKLIVGHFLYGFRKYVRKPYLMITTLREPLELFVSGQQFMHRDETRTLAAATAWVSRSMKDRIRLSNSIDVGFNRRFLDDGHQPVRFNPMDASSLEMAHELADAAIEHLHTFFLVGVVEQYSGFMEVLKLSLDPEVKHKELWGKAVKIKNNGSPVRSGDVLQQIDPDLVKEFNSTVLGLQWKTYTVALQLWDSKCREVLPLKRHEDLCSVQR